MEQHAIDQHRITILEERVRALETLVRSRLGATLNTAVETSGLNWIYVDAEQVNDDIVDAITSMYIGRNYDGFRDHVQGQFPASVLLLGENGNVSRPAAAIIVKKHPCGNHIKLNIHKHRSLVTSHIAPKYTELLTSNIPHFTEISSGTLEDSIRQSGINNVTNPNIITFIAQIGSSRIVLDPCDTKCRMHPLANGDPCPVGSYITQSGKRMALYGNPSIENNM